MFEVGFQELVLIALLALIVLGPEKLPKLAAKLGRWTGQARSMARNLRHQLEQEVSYDELLHQKQLAEEALRKATHLANEHSTPVHEPVLTSTTNIEQPKEIEHQSPPDNAPTASLPSSSSPQPQSSTQ